MSIMDYKASLHIAMEDPPFYAIIMAAMRKADTTNVEKLKSAFPETWIELLNRHESPGGLLRGESEVLL